MEINNLWGFEGTQIFLVHPLDENNAENKEYCADEQLPPRSVISMI